MNYLFILFSILKNIDFIIYLSKSMELEEGSKRNAKLTPKLKCSIFLVSMVICH